MSALGSAPIPPPGEDDHVRPPFHLRTPLRTLIIYSDFECPFCGALQARLDGLAVRVVFRHFPVSSSHPRAWPAAAAAEAAGRQGEFWEMHDALFSDQSRLEDPHLWDRARRLGLDLRRFDADRRSDEIAERVKRDFRAGVRGGIVTTPAIFEVSAHGELVPLAREQFGVAPG